MKKVLVLGASGMMGHMFATYLEENGYDIDNLSMSTSLNKKTVILDLMDKNVFENFLTKQTYDVIINAAGILIEQSEKQKDLATYMNSFLPHFLENRYRGSTTKIIQLSTDCVFSGENGPYKEDSAYDGELFYDRTKALGEIFNDKDLTFRMSTVGPEIQKDGVGLFNWFMKQKGQIFGYKNAIWSGVTTHELARGIDAAIKQNITGLYHLVPTTSIAKYDLLCLFKDAFRRDDVQIEAKEGGVVADKTLINTRKDFDFKVSDYTTMINEMRDWVDRHENIYHY